MFKKEFWKAVAERAVKTFAQSLSSVLISAGVGLLAADWVGAISTAGMALVISVLTSIGSAALTDGSPSVVSSEVLTNQTYENYPSVELDPQLDFLNEDPSEADMPETDVAEEEYDGDH
jgi:hypothetical protein